MSDEPTKVTNLAEFKKKNSELVRTCKCGSQLYYLKYGEPGLCGEIECRLCGEILVKLCWGSRDEE